MAGLLAAMEKFRDAAILREQSFPDFSPLPSTLFGGQPLRKSSCPRPPGKVGPGETGHS